MTAIGHNIFNYLANPVALGSLVNGFAPQFGSISEDEVSIAGTDAWLYLYKGSNDYYHSYSERRDDAAVLANSWTESISGFFDLFDRSVKFVPVIIPNKASVIRDFYPISLHESMTPRLRMLRGNLLNNVYCPVEELSSNANNAYVFRKLDTHMTEYGNLYFATGILERFGIDWRCLHLPAELVFRDHGGDLGRRYATKLVEKVARFRYSDSAVVSIKEISPPVGTNTGLIYESTCLNAPLQAKLIVFGNSFFERPNSWGMAPIFCRIFRSVRFHWESGVYKEYIDEYSPDYAIFQTCERFLSSIARKDPHSRKCYDSKFNRTGKLIMTNATPEVAEGKNFNITITAGQAGDAYISGNSIGKVGPNVTFPLHQLVNHEKALLEHGITVVSEDGVSISRIDVSSYIKFYLSEQRLLDKLQSSIAAGKWVIYAFRPKSDGFILVDFGIVLPINLQEKSFIITCDGREPVESYRYYDKHLGASHWFMPSGCVIGVRCRFEPCRLTPYLHFDFSFVDPSLAEYSRPYRTLVNFTDMKMLDGLPDIARIQRVASKNANRNSFLNGGRTSYLALKSIAEREGVNFGTEGIRILDWGVGCGRVARHFLEHKGVKFTGIDIDEDNLRWCEKNLGGSYVYVNPEPPTILPSESFDLIYSCSVLSHLTESDAAKWLGEMARVISGSGVALLSYNGLSNSASYLSRRPLEFQRILDRKLFDADVNHELDGFIPGKDYYRATFASDEWWLDMFSKFFDIVRIEYSVVNGYQHIAVLRKKVGN